MKVALLSRWYWEETRRYGEEGGPTRQLAEAVAALGNEVVVLSQSPEVRRLTQAKIGPLEVWLSPRDKRRGVLAGLRDKFAKGTFHHRKLHSDALTLRDFLVQRGPFDVLWAQTEAPDGLVAGFAAEQRIAVPPILVQIQDLRFRFEKGVPIFTEQVPLMLAFRHATRIIANSEMLAGYLGAYTGPTLSPGDLEVKLRMLYPNLYRGFLRAAQADPLEIKPMTDRVLYLGALNVNKGVMPFLKSLPRTDVSRRSGVFAVIGDFTENNRRFAKRWEAMKEAVRIQTLGARIEYLGKVSTFEVIRQVRLAQVVVVPSLFDAFSRAVVEALILGRPVITTDRVGAAAIVREHQCGIVVPPNDPESLARAIDAVLSPIVPFAENARRVGPRLAHEFTAEAIGLRMAHNLSRTAGLT
ncbi:MAG: glycosyltransferase family 4 protein [Verrucomicrobiota bacterium]